MGVVSITVVLVFTLSEIVDMVALGKIGVGDMVIVETGGEVPIDLVVLIVFGGGGAVPMDLLVFVVFDEGEADSTEVLGGGGAVPLEVLGGGGAVPLELLGGGGAVPLELLGGGGAVPLELLGGGGAVPLELFGGGGPVEIEVWGGGGGAGVLDVTISVAVEAVEAILQKIRLASTINSQDARTRYYSTRDTSVCPRQQRQQWPPRSV